MMKINEKLLQQIWQHQYFNTRELQLCDSGTLEIVHPGIYNTNQGPDFLESRIRIDGTLLIGNIELHVLASDWNRHSHDMDSNYRNIILHVVWCNDEPKHITAMPTLELQHRVSLKVLDKYAELIMNTNYIPCGSQINKPGHELWKDWYRELIHQRFKRRTVQIRKMLNENNSHWEEVLWWMIARNFGYSINAAAFETIARSIPYNLLLRHKPMIIQLEAILFGQAGLLKRKFSDDYPKMLQKEYDFYKKKYTLLPAVVPVQFLRMRPVNFPSIRLAQLAVLISRSPNLFSLIKNADSLKELMNMFELTANDYWHYHFVFDESSAYQPKNLGVIMIQNLMINTVLPILYAYGEITGDSTYSMNAISWLEKLPAEKNKILQSFSQLGIQAVNAATGQALLELKTQYCDQHNCLDCRIGKVILNEELRTS